MTYFLSPALDQLRAEINARWPGRDKASDGWIGNLEHSARTSDHNPDENGSVNAFDIDRDGIDAWAVALAAMADRRCNYVIWAGRIYRRATGFRSEPYYGVNGHYHHVHISILHGDVYEQDRSPWFTPLTDWFDMATEADLRAIVREQLIDILRAPEFVRIKPATPASIAKAVAEVPLGSGVGTLGQAARDSRIIARRVEQSLDPQVLAKAVAALLPGGAA